MSTESIILLALVIAAVAVAAWQLRKKKANPASPPAQATQPSAVQATQPSAAPASKRLTAADYADSFFSGWLAGMGLLAQALIDAPRSLGKRSLGEGQGDFGGGS